MINYNWQNVNITMISNDLPGGVLKFDCFHEDGFQGYGTSEEKAMVLFYQTARALKPNYSLTVIVKDNNNSSVITYTGVVITKPSSVTHKKDGALEARTWEFKAESRNILYY